MRITLEVRNVSYDKTICHWVSEPEIGEDLSLFGYVVEVSGGPEGPWIPLFNDPVYAYGFVDTNLQQDNATYYYRVKAIDFNKKEFVSDPVLLANETNSYIAKFIGKQEQRFLKQFAGRKFLHYAKMKFGKRCPHCYSSVERKIIRPNCSVCYGTTYELGYFAPTKIYVDLDPNVKATDRTERGEVENEQFPAWTSNEVIIESQDILIDLDSLIRYKVENVAPTALLDKIIKQPMTLTKLRKDNPAYLIKVDENIFDLEEFHFFRRIK